MQITAIRYRTWNIGRKHWGWEARVVGLRSGSPDRAFGEATSKAKARAAAITAGGVLERRAHAGWVTA